MCIINLNLQQTVAENGNTQIKYKYLKTVRVQYLTKYT